MRREVYALAALAAVALLGVIAVFAVGSSSETPVQRTTEQNYGSNAPHETLPSPGTVEDPAGNPRLPAQQ